MMRVLSLALLLLGLSLAPAMAQKPSNEPYHQRAEEWGQQQSEHEATPPNDVTGDHPVQGVETPIPGIETPGPSDQGMQDDGPQSGSAHTGTAEDGGDE
jgi:hypothetical protein